MTNLPECSIKTEATTQNKGGKNITWSFQEVQRRLIRVSQVQNRKNVRKEMIGQMMEDLSELKDGGVELERGH